MGALVHIRTFANSEDDNATEELAEVIMYILDDAQFPLKHRKIPPKHGGVFLLKMNRSISITRKK